MRGLVPPLLAAALGAFGAACVALVADSMHGALVTLAILLPAGALSIIAAGALVRSRARVGGLRRQFGALALLAATQVVAVVGLCVWLMYVSGHDALLTVLIVAYAGALAGWAARLMGRGALGDVEAIRATVTAVGNGRRDVRTGVAGTDELGRLAAGVDAMVDRLAGEEQARATLVAGLSHDLRTPITSLRLIADAIGDGLLDEDELRLYASRMSTHISALGTLIEGLFELSRMESGGEELRPESVQLDALARQAVEALRPVAEEAEVTLICDADRDSAAVRADPERVLRVLFNLLQNAIRHSPRGGHVRVSVGAAGPGAVQIRVADEGPGVPAADRDRVFLPFFRGDPSRTDAGAGLGLAISRAIVDAHGGELDFADVPRGATAVLALPVVASGRLASASPARDPWDEREPSRA